MGKTLHIRPPHPLHRHLGHHIGCRIRQATMIHHPPLPHLTSQQSLSILVTYPCTSIPNHHVRNIFNYRRNLSKNWFALDIYIYGVFLVYITNFLVCWGYSQSLDIYIKQKKYLSRPYYTICATDRGLVCNRQAQRP